jgi:biopolymer transport protein ExbD
MAEIQTTTSANKHTGSKQKKLSTRVDLTPMVDLGFLLITFFIFTTAISKPNSMKLFLPKEDENTIETQIPRSKVLTILPAANNIIYYYYGDNPLAMQQTNFSEDGIRKIILDKKKEVAAKFGDAKQTVVLIKPTDNTTYQNMVDILDEMLINNINRYMLLDADKEELQQIKG